MPVLHHIISELLENRNETEGMSEYQEEGTKLRTDEGSLAALFEVYLVRSTGVYDFEERERGRVNACVATGSQATRENCEVANLVH